MTRTLKTLLLAASFACLGPAGANEPAKPSAAFRVDTPFVVTPAVEEAVLATDVWAELYRVPRAQRKQALDKLVKFNQTPTPLGVSLGGFLHLQVNGKPVKFGEQSISLTRNGAAVAYDEQCLAVPARGDRLEAVYAEESTGVQLTVTATVFDHYAFGPSSPLASESTRFDKVTAENCQSVQESRILYDGELVVRQRGKIVHREPVMLQSVLQ